MRTHHSSRRDSGHRGRSTHARSGESSRRWPSTSARSSRSRGRRTSRFKPIVLRLLQNPLIPLLVISAMVLFIALRAKVKPEDARMQAQLSPVGKGFDDTRRAFVALKLMDENRMADAAATLQPLLSQSPLRLSGLIEKVRGGAAEARGDLSVLIDDWLLEQAASNANAFPSQKTPTLVLDFIAEVAAYYEALPPPQRSAAAAETLEAMFKRTSIERKLRLLEVPAHLRGGQ